METEAKKYTGIKELMRVAVGLPLLVAAILLVFAKIELWAAVKFYLEFVGGLTTLMVITELIKEKIIKKRELK